MKLSWLALAVGCLALATSAWAGGTWIGPSLAFPVPTADIGNSQLGVNAGLTLEQMVNPYFGIGLDVAYHYWPTTSEYMAAYDRFLQGWYQTFDGSTWSLSAVQYTAHLKLVGPAVGRCAPWLWVGGGYYRVDRNFADPDWEGSMVRVVKGGPAHSVVLPGGFCGVGVDFRTSSRVLLGVDATYHFVDRETEASVWGREIIIPRFTALTLGTHILFRM